MHQHDKDKSCVLPQPTILIITHGSIKERSLQMWIEERKTKSGTTYKFNERYTDPYTGKLKRISVTLPTKTRAAIKQATLMLQEKISKRIGTCIDEKPLDYVIQEWLAYRAVALKPSSLRDLTQQLRTITRKLPENILISRIDLAMIQSVITDMQTRKISRNHIVKTLNSLRRLFKYAVKMNFVTSDKFLEDVEIQHQAKTRDQIERQSQKYLDRNTLIKVLEETKTLHPRIGLLCEFQVLTGLRIGELVALREIDYDKEKGEIDINGSYDPFAHTRTTPKTTTSFRRIKLNKRARQIIDAFITENYQRTYWYNGYKNQGYIFTTNRGNPIARAEIARILRKLSIPQRVTTHTFRHTHISMLLEAGVPIRAVMQRVGHSTMQTTMEIYAHVSQAAQEEVIVKFDEFLNRQKA